MLKITKDRIEDFIKRKVAKSMPDKKMVRSADRDQNKKHKAYVEHREMMDRIAQENRSYKKPKGEKIDRHLKEVIADYDLRHRAWESKDPKKPKY